MKQELSLDDLNQVIGGSIVITDGGSIGFTTLRQAFKLKNISWKDARSYVEDQLELHPELKDKEFDEYIKAQMQARGWI